MHNLKFENKHDPICKLYASPYKTSTQLPKIKLSYKPSIIISKVITY